MANEVVAAFVVAGATVVAATIPLVWSRSRIGTRGPLSNRRRALLGRWEGEGTDYYVDDSSKGLRRFAASMTFTSVGHTVKATAALRETGLNEEDKVCLFGMFYDHDYLQLSYYNEDLGRKQLGVVVLGLGPDGASLRGYYTGFSPRRGTIVAGTIQLQKKA